MPEVHQVSAIVANPKSRHDRGRCTIGYFTLDGDVLTMTDGDGVPARRRYDGETIRHHLTPGEDPWKGV